MERVQVPDIQLQEQGQTAVLWLFSRLSTRTSRYFVQEEEKPAGVNKLLSYQDSRSDGSRDTGRILRRTAVRLSSVSQPSAVVRSGMVPAREKLRTGYPKHGSAGPSANHKVRCPLFTNRYSSLCASVSFAKLQGRGLDCGLSLRLYALRFRRRTRLIIDNNRRRKTIAVMLAVSLPGWMCLWLGTVSEAETPGDPVVIGVLHGVDKASVLVPIRRDSRPWHILAGTSVLCTLPSSIERWYSTGSIAVLGDKGCCHLYSHPGKVVSRR